MSDEEEFDQLCRKINAGRIRAISQLEDSQTIHKGILSRSIGVLSSEELKEEYEHHQRTEEFINLLKSHIDEDKP